MKKAIIAAAVLVVLGVGGFLLANSSKGSGQPAKESSTNSQTSSAPNTIVFNGSSFSPATLTVKSGTTVTVKNTSSTDLQFDSDPHPVHTDDPELNVGVVAPGQSATFTAKTSGSFGYHDHLDPSIQGKIVVQ